ncbi:hypothetical protein I5G59_gp52 [Mycobacterium phage LilMcDreamy]|uniref:Uncharacterized protein n=1 Tax=Mycobacterium phage LilMcDreamy TaxID=2652422 RepID=A0A5P8D8B0_9CAUD|nr:hypothetical protein I5G59_gp52 [Mycobacterium phage LilMcDreamy]QFP94672.1 hypothetical protein SEA_LILMCDREAMY_52 [Mycobacterium phage LilMcDreamy]
MSVNLDKTLLIAAAQEALDGHDKADVIYQRDVAAYRAERAKKNDRLPGMRALRDELSALIKAKRQPTEEDAKRFKSLAGCDYLSNFHVTEVTDYDVRNNVKKPPNWLPEGRRASYQGLIKMLNAHVEPTITANQLKLFGYTDLEALFRAAAQSGALR